jgi:hypothetical protein
MWVVQEVVLAPKVYVLCGEASTHFHFLMLAFTFLYSFVQLNAFSGGKLNAHTDKVFRALSCNPLLIEAVTKARGQSSFPMDQALQNTQGFQASMKQDYIYGLLGMVSDLDSLSIDVD